jgi:integrase
MGMSFDDAAQLQKDQALDKTQIGTFSSASNGENKCGENPKNKGAQERAAQDSSAGDSANRASHATCKQGSGDARGNKTLTCPECGSKGPFYRDGLRYLKNGETRQRWLCRDCELRFTEADPARGKGSSSKRDAGGPLKEFSEQLLNTSKGIVEDRQVCVSNKEAKNLDTTTKTNIVVGERKPSQDEAITKGKILELCIHMKRQGYSEETIRLNRGALKVLHERGADLFDQESVKDVISKQNWSPSRRKNVINAYSMFLKLNKMSWEPPRCVVTSKIPFIPTEQEIDALISAAPRKLSAFLLLLKETAMRRGEAKRLEWVNIDSERNTITLNDPEKHSNPRMWKVPTELIAQLNALPKNSQKVFGDCKMDSLKSAFLNLRKKQAFKLQNPRLLKINFHSFRHWKATMLYHKTRDPLYVKDFLGHKSIKNTEKYITIERTMFTECGNDEFTVKIAQTPRELTLLLEVGFEYVCQKDNLIFLRKRK